MTGLNASAAADVLQSVMHRAEPALSDEEHAELSKVHEYLLDADSCDVEGVEAHLYSAMNDGEMGDTAHEHVSRAYNLLDAGSEGSEGNDTRDDVHGSFVARDLYPDYDELHERVRERASERFGMDDIDTSPDTWDINYVCLEDGVVLYKVEHERLGVPKVES